LAPMKIILTKQKDKKYTVYVTLYAQQPSTELSIWLYQTD